MKSSSRSSKRKSKRSQKHSKKKTRSSREKTKKLKQRDHSVSCTDEDSISKTLVSCSSPVEENRSKKRGRSRDEKRRKDKKRRKRSSLLSKNSGDDSPLVKKPKKSKRNRGSDSRKKRNVKKRRRDRDVSSSNSQSNSLNDDCERQIEGKEEKVELKERKGREKGKEPKKRKRDQSVSSSSQSRGQSCEPNDDNEREFEGMEEKVELKERKGREKGKERKGRKRDRSVSSSSSPSWSRYTCKENDDYEIEREGKEEKVGMEAHTGREKGKERNVSKRSWDRSRSSSPRSLHSESISYYSKERELEKNNPKRLKSIIVVMKEGEVAEEQTSNRDDGHKDEIVCEFDDYRSKSNDSNDGVCGREAGSYSNYVSSEKRPFAELNRDSVISDVRTSEIPAVQREAAEGSGGVTPSYVRSEADDPLMESRSEVCVSNAGSLCDDLETSLRQKALENLLKRRGKLSTSISADMKDDHDIEVKRSSIVKAQLVDQHISYDETNSKSVHKEEKVVDHVRSFSNSHSPSKHNGGRLLSMKVETTHSNEKGKAPGILVNSKSDVGIPTSKKEFLGAKNTWKRQLSLQEKSQKNLSVSRELVANNSKQQLNSQEHTQSKLSVSQETISKDSTRDFGFPGFDPKGSTENNVTVAASEPSASVEQGTNDKTNEADEEGQFQQKTMSVMRGGEMVQVSYKVYIPKKAPALARRQLKR
ncbi:hypothetical protein RDABS01_032700 [Bienertia sinuspersici]